MISKAQVVGSLATGRRAPQWPPGPL